MTDIKSKLKSIVDLYTVLRQCGHTTAVLEGAKNTNAIVITHHNGMGDYIDELTENKVKTVSINSLERLRGMRTPIVFDNAALMELASDALREINKLESTITSLKKSKI